MQIVLETERLFLREMEHADFDALYAVLGDSDIMRHYPYIFDEARVRRWIDVNLQRYRQLGFGLWAMCLKESDAMIGDHVAKNFQRKGYASEAARACRDWAFENTAFDRIYSYMKADNAPSLATAKAAGMAFVKTFIDAEGEATAVYAVTREVWKSIK